MDYGIAGIYKVFGSGKSFLRCRRSGNGGSNALGLLRCNALAEAD